MDPWSIDHQLVLRPLTIFLFKSSTTLPTTPKWFRPAAWECGFEKKRAVCYVFFFGTKGRLKIASFCCACCQELPNSRVDTLELGGAVHHELTLESFRENAEFKILSISGKAPCAMFDCFRIRFAAFAFGASSSSILPSAVFVKNLASRAKTLLENGTVMDMKKAKTWRRTKGSDHVRRQWDWKMFWWLSKTMRQWSSTSGLMRICRSCHWLQPTDIVVPCNDFPAVVVFGSQKVAILFQKLVIQISENWLWPVVVQGSETGRIHPERRLDAAWIQWRSQKGWSSWNTVD